jgi:hypothetical protein
MKIACYNENSLLQLKQVVTMKITCYLAKINGVAVGELRKQKNAHERSENRQNLLPLINKTKHYFS